MSEIIKEEKSGRGKVVYFKCEVCNKVSRKSKKHFDRVEHNFCSNKCKGVYFSGENCKSWNSGFYIDEGYKKIHKTLVEKKYKKMLTNRGYILHHRYVVAEHLERPLTEDEVVHHINGNKLDNRIENLEIMEKWEHTTHHLKGKPNIKQRGENCPTSKLTKMDVIKIKKILNKGKFTQIEIGKMFGVSNANISAIKRGKNWSHISI